MRLYINQAILTYFLFCTNSLLTSNYRKKTCDSSTYEPSSVKKNLISFIMPYTNYNTNNYRSITNPLCTETKKFSKFFMSLVFVYNLMSLKGFLIEQSCPSNDSMTSLVFVQYAIMNE